jgi:type IV/VI secretion system ImpK/VasF family protein
MNTVQTLPLLDCTRHSLTLIYKLRTQQSVNIEELTDALDRCKTVMKKHLYTESMVEKTDYLLSSAIDEAYANCAAKAPGTAMNLLATHYRQANGGERFFDVLEHYINFNDEYRPLLELCFVILGSGFRGKFALHEDGAAILLKKRQQLSNMLYGDYHVPTQVTVSAKPRLVHRLLAARIFHKKYWLSLIAAGIVISFAGDYVLQYQVDLLQANVQQSQKNHRFE